MEQINTTGGIFSKKDQLEAAKLQLKKVLENDKHDTLTINTLEARIKGLEKEVNLGVGDIASVVDSWEVDGNDQLEDIEMQIQNLESQEQTDDVKKMIENLKARRTKLQVEL